LDFKSMTGAHRFYEKVGFTPMHKGWFVKSLE